MSVSKRQVEGELVQVYLLILNLPKTGNESAAGRQDQSQMIVVPLPFANNGFDLDSNT